MDIDRYKRLAFLKIEAGEMTESVRNDIKEVQTSKQDIFEERKE